MNTIAIIQARMSSSRLPGKVLLDVGGKPLLQHMLTRLQKAKMIDGVVLATTSDPSDDILVRYCWEHNLDCFRGSLQDVLDRCYRAAADYDAEVVVRLTADCPLIDPEVLDLTVKAFLGEFTPPNPLLSDTPIPQPADRLTYDFAANRLPPPWKRTLPIGLDVEVCSFEALQRAWKEAQDLHQREHVLPYLYEGVAFEEELPPTDVSWYIQQGNTPRGFRVALLNHFPDYGSLRWTVDTPADLEFVRQVYARFGGEDDFGWEELLALLDREPDLARINADVKHKSAFDVDERHARQ